MVKMLLLFFICLELVRCGPDLCENNRVDIDAITWVETSRMWFFTSKGHYWYIKEDDFPPKVPGTPLPDPFKRGDAVFYKDTMTACRGIQPVDGKNVPQEQEIHLLELVDGANQVMIYDTRNNDWLPGTKKYNNYHDLQQVKVDLNQPIDAAFTYQSTYIALLQKNSYAFVDLKPLCTDPDGFGKAYDIRSLDDLNHQDPVRAMSIFKEKSLLLLSGDSFWKLTNIRFFSSSGKIIADKEGSQQDPAMDFFGYEQNCQLPGTEPSTTGGEYDPGPVGEQNPQPTGETGEPTNDEELITEEAGKGDDNNNGENDEDFPWIILIIIAIIVIIILVLLIACVLMRKKSKDPESGVNPIESRSKSSGGSQRSKTGTAMKSMPSSLSTMSVRSKAGPSQSPGSKASPKAGSKTGSKAGPSSMMGSSPSTMSVRSNPGISTSPSKASSKAK